MSRRIALISLLLFACAKHETATAPAAQQPSILLVTLDTTRGDAIGPNTPAFNRVAAQGMLFRQAYAPVPQTLPSHSSMLTGLYPAGHGVHENGRYLAQTQGLLAEQLKEKGYETAAFVSAFALARRFGLGRGFDRYDDDFGGEAVERTAAQTNARVTEYLRQPHDKPLFLWVHYYDPHYPYAPPEPYRTRFKTNPYAGEIAAMDEQLGRLVDEFRKTAKGPVAIVIAGDHGEGLREHGESQHGDLLYQGTMRVPLVIAGPGIGKGASDAPVSTRRIFHTILDWAGIDASHSLRGAHEPVVLGEAMKPFLDFGWQPQVMAVEGRHKTILSGGRAEVYDVVADPQETRDLGSVPRAARAALRDYPLPSPNPAPAPSSSMSDEDRKKLAALGYVTATVKPVIRRDAPRPAEMAHLLDDLDAASALFVRGRYAEAIPVLEKILAADPYNLDSALRLATSHSSLGHDADAERAFERAQQIAPDSADVRTYFALHLAKGKNWGRAVPMLERVVAEDPARMPAVQALAVIRERQGRLDEAVALRQKIYEKRTPTTAELVQLGEMAMSIGNTPAAIAAFERAGQGHDLELGVLYLAAGRLEDARTALDRIKANDPNYPMAAFKRAQVAVLLREPDAARRIEVARTNADATTRALIERERLFK